VGQELSIVVAGLPYLVPNGARACGSRPVVARREIGAAALWILPRAMSSRRPHASGMVSVLAVASGSSAGAPAVAVARFSDSARLSHRAGPLYDELAPPALPAGPLAAAGRPARHNRALADQLRRLRRSSPLTLSSPRRRGDQRRSMPHVSSCRRR